MSQHTSAAERTTPRERRTVRIARAIRRFAEHPITRIVVGGILFLTALYEIEEGLWIELKQDGVESHHGIAAFGILTMVAALPDLLEGLVAATEYVDGSAKAGRADASPSQ